MCVLERLSPLRRFWDRFWRYAGGVSVRMKIFGIVLGSALLLSAAFIYQARQTFYRLMESELRQLGLSIARDVAARSTDLLLINDLYAVHTLLRDTRNSFPDVRYIFIISPEGEVLVHTFGPEGFPKGLRTSHPLPPGRTSDVTVLRTNEGWVWDVVVPVFEGRLGEVHVGISDVRLQETLRLLTWQMGVALAAVLAMGMLVSSLLTWVLSRPIRLLSEATQAVARGNLDVYVQPWAEDELGALARAFNHMVQELRRMDELRREREMLRRQLLERVIQAQEDERRAISRELHDSTSQALSSLLMGLRTLMDSCDRASVKQQAQYLHQVTTHILEEVHRLAARLRPMLLDDLGLEAALSRYIREWQQHTGLMVDAVIHLGERRLPPAVETALYRIVQEALTNVARHARGATQVSLVLERRKEEISLIVEDDGSGFDAQSVDYTRHLGLLGMRERAELLGGSFTLESTPGRGTTIFVRIPLGEEKNHVASQTTLAHPHRG